MPTATTPVSASNTTVIVLAAGRGERFVQSGGATHKLQALLAGKPVQDHVLQTVQASGLRCHIVQPLKEAGLQGMGDSIARGVRATADAQGWLILPADLPLVQPQTLLQVAAALQEHPVVVPMWHGQQGHPVGFARECFTALSNLEGDKGASRIVQSYRHIQRLQMLPVGDAGIATDIDTVDDLALAEAWLASRNSAVAANER